MNNKEEIFDYVISKRNELAEELYDFFGKQKQEIYENIDTQKKNLGNELYEFVDMQKQEIYANLYKWVGEKFGEWVEEEQKRNDFVCIKRFFENTDAKQTNRMIIMGVPEHGNLGDHAITCGEEIFLRDNFRDIPFLLLSWRMLVENINYLKGKISGKDIICVTGGGFLGSLWLEEQEKVNLVLRSFKENPIVIFPQTFWCEDIEHTVCLSEFEEAVLACSNVCVCLREESSLQRFRQEYPHIKSILVPDMALCMKVDMNVICKNDVLFCIRKDKEKVLENEWQLKKIVEEKGYSCRETSTVLNEKIMLDMSEKYVLEKLIEFASAKLVITDRLHGMIFAALVGTPCIAFNNVSKKVEGVYSWLKSSDIIQIVKNEDEFAHVFDVMINKEKCKLDFDDTYYNELVYYLKNINSN